MQHVDVDRTDDRDDEETDGFEAIAKQVEPDEIKAVKALVTAWEQSDDDILKEAELRSFISELNEVLEVGTPGEKATRVQGQERRIRMGRPS